MDARSSSAPFPDTTEGRAAFLAEAGGLDAAIAD